MRVRNQQSALTGYWSVGKSKTKRIFITGKGAEVRRRRRDKPQITLPKLNLEENHERDT